jgi:CHAD domain-containing protein
MSDAGDAGETKGMPVPPRLCDFAAEVTAQRLDKMLSHVEGVRKAEDTEAVHQMRVWSRRSRAALEIFRVCFTGRAFAEVEREVKAATDALSEARDLDVMIENLEDRAAKLPASRRGGIQSFVDLLRAQREARQHAVAQAVTDLESHNLAQRFRELASRTSERRTKRAAANGRSNAKSARNGKGGRRHG